MSHNCVVKGTLITLENDKTKTIESLKVGEKLLSYSISGIENSQDESLLGKTKVNEFNGEFSYQLIKNIWTNPSDKYYRINNRLSITGDHFVLCRKNNEYYWNQVDDLKNGDSLFKSNNEFETITKIEEIEDKHKVYNIQVNSIFAYFASGYLIHNGTACSQDYCETCYNA